MSFSILRKVKKVFFSGDHFAGQFINYYLHRLWSKHALGRFVPLQPLTLSIVTTGRCNLKCAMCVTHSPLVPNDYEWRQMTTTDMEFNTFKYTLDRFQRAMSVSLIGVGEPLLNKDFFRMVEYASTVRRMNASSVSNGIILDKNIDQVVGSHLDYIVISLNTHDGNDYQRLTGHPPSFHKKIFDNISKLVEARDKAESRLKIYVSFIVDQENYRFIPECIRVGEQTGADHIYFNNFLPYPFEGFEMGQRTLLVNDKEVRKVLENSIATHMRDKVTLPTLLNPDQQKKNCRCHFTTLRVDGERNYSSCPVMLANMEGEKKVTDTVVWNSSFLREMRGRFLSPGKDDLHDPCKVCTQNFGVDLHNVKKEDTLN